MDFEINFDAANCDLSDMGDHFILNFWHGIDVEVDIIFQQKEWLKELYQEMVGESAKSEVSFADDFEPIEPELPGWKMSFTIYP